jgi:KaiC/GvpD/RAD55 family RecA-like ATPase
LIEGEIPRGIYLLTGNSGAGKTVFCKTFMARGLSNQEPGIYLSTEDDCDKIQASIQKLVENQDIMKGDLKLIDAYSWRVRGVMGSGPFVTIDPANLSGVIIACQKVCHGMSKPRFVFDSITNLAIQSDPDTTLKFLQLVTAKMRSMNALAFFTLIPTSHDNMFVSTVKTMFDGIFEMRLVEDGLEITRMFRIFSIKGAKHQTRWVVFTIKEEYRWLKTILRDAHGAVASSHTNRSRQLLMDATTRSMRLNVQIGSKENWHLSSHSISKRNATKQFLFDISRHAYLEPDKN